MNTYNNVLAITLLILSFAPSALGMLYGRFFLYGEKRWICGYLIMFTMGLSFVLGFALWGAFTRVMDTRDGMTSFFVMSASQWICASFAWWSTTRGIRWFDHRREILRQKKDKANINTPPYSK